MSNSELLSNLDHESRNAAAKIRETAGTLGKMAGAAVSAVENMASQTAENFSDDADYLASSAGRGVQRIGEQLSRVAPDSGIVGVVSQSVVRTITEGGEYFEGSKLSGLRQDLTKVISRNPIPTILISIGLGWIASRMLRR